MKSFKFYLNEIKTKEIDLSKDNNNLMVYFNGLDGDTSNKLIKYIKNPNSPFILVTIKPDKIEEIIDLNIGKYTFWGRINNKYYEFKNANSKIIRPVKDFQAGGKATPARETFYLEVFKFYNKTGKIITEFQLLRKIIKYYPKFRPYYRSVYYYKAIEQLSEFKKLNLKDTYHFEKQGEKYSAIIYEKASALGVGKKDRWNPGDIWLFNNTGIKELDKLNYFENLQELNEFISYHLENKNIISVSLKHLTTGKPKLIINNQLKGTYSPELPKINYITMPKTCFSATINTDQPNGIQLSTNSKNRNLSIRLRNAQKNINASNFRPDYENWLKQFSNHIYLNDKFDVNSIPDTEIKKYIKIIKKYHKNNMEVDFYNLSPDSKHTFIILGSNLDVIINNWTSFTKMAWKNSLTLDSEKSSAHIIIK